MGCGDKECAGRKVGNQHIWYGGIVDVDFDVRDRWSVAGGDFDLQRRLYHGVGTALTVDGG